MSAWWKRIATAGPRAWSAMPLVLAVLTAFGLLTWWSVNRVASDQRQELLDATHLVAEAMNVERVRRLIDPGISHDDPTLQRIRRQLGELRQSHPLCSDIHLLAQADDGTIRHLESDEGRGDSTDPLGGVEPDHGQQLLRDRFRVGGGVVLGPWSDSDGTWMAGIDAIREPRSGAVVALVAMRFRADGWRNSMAAEATPFALATLVLLLVIAASVFQPRWRSEPVPHTAHRKRSSLPILALATGSILTLLLSWELNHHEKAAITRQFHVLSTERAKGIVEKLRIIRETELESLVRFFSGSDAVSRSEFQQFSTYLVRNRMILAWAWLHRVDSGAVARFSDSVGKAEHATFRIWERDSAGKPRPATPRAWHMPVMDVSPSSASSRRMVGFDFASEPNRRKAIEEATRTKIPVSTLPVTMPAGDSLRRVMIFMRPILGRDDSSQVQGFAVAAMELDAPLRTVDADSLFHIELQLLRSDSSPLPLCSTPHAEDRSSLDSNTVPFLGFGRTFAVKIRPTHRFVDAHPARMAWIGLLAGMSLTLGISLALLVALRRRQELETLVTHRTEQLLETERSYRNQFAANSSVMLMIDPRDRMIVDANDAASRYYGYSRDQLLRMRITDLNPAPDEDFAPTRQDGPSRGSRFEFQHRLADGQIREVEISSSFVQFGANTVLHAIIHDITERKRIEQDRQSLEQRLEWALAATGEGVWDWSIATDTIKHNPRWCEILGLNDAYLEHPLQTFLDRLHPEDRQDVFDRVQACLEGKGPYHSSHRMVRADGAVIHVVDRGDVVERAVDGSPLRMVGSMADITERRNAEEALRESETKRRLAMDFARMAPWQMDLKKGVFLFDDKFYSLYGTTAEAEGGYEMTADAYAARFLYPEDAIIVPREIGSSLETDSPDFSRQIEHRVRRPDGREMYVAVQYGVVKDSAGETIRIFGANQDITERKLAELTLRSMNDSLEEATARANSLAAHAEMASIAKSEFLANMSHEIRTPMNGIIGMTGLLMDTALDPKQRRYAEIVRQSGESLLALLNDILDLSKIEAGKLELEMLDFDPRTMLDDFGSLLAVRAAQKKLEFVCAVDPRIPNMLRGDPGRLRQILLNLGGNAIKFTEHGEITVRAALVSEVDGAATIRFSVKDSGIGIPADKIPQLFQKFTQVDATITRKFGGTGLGLAISRQLVELMDGEIGIESVEGKGSEFWFTAVFEVRPSHDGVLEEIEAVRGARFLVVDDNATNREVLRTQIESWGGRVEEAEDGPSALQRLHDADGAKDGFAAVLLDRQMPRMDGLELARAIRSDEDLRDTTLILMPSITHKGDSDAIHELGFAATLVKPARQSDLLDALSSAMGHAPRKAAPSTTTERVIPDFGASRARILLAEDNVVNQMVATGILEGFGLRVDVVANGLEALRALETLPYDIVLMDVQMPEMDGFEATRRIRDPLSAVRDHAVPVIAMTANAMRGDREACLDAGMSDYVSKPVNPRELALALERWIPAEARAVDDSLSSATDLVLPVDPLAGMKAFDREALLQRVMGSEKLMKRVIGSFLETVPFQIDAMGEHLERGEFADAARIAHGIKGAAANIAADTIAATAADTEKASLEGLAAPALSSWSRLHDQFELWKDEATRA